MSHTDVNGSFHITIFMVIIFFFYFLDPPMHMTVHILLIMCCFFSVVMVMVEGQALTTCMREERISNLGGMTPVSGSKPSIAVLSGGLK